LMVNYRNPGVHHAIVELSPTPKSGSGAKNHSSQ
jgi:hypothetical protein